MTEDEARTKWCPFVQVSAGATGLDDIDNRQGGYCIGSDCMAWRRHRVEDEHGAQQFTLEAPEMYPDDKYTIYGHCGLAGQPHDV